MGALFTIRNVKPADLVLANMLSAAEGMGPVQEGDCIRVAVNEGDEVVGFARFVFDEAGTCHVNPVVVYPTWRRYGVGRALMNDALARYGEVRLVSRGNSKAFYEALGFVPCAWSDIYAPVARECDECELREECNPQPMHFKL